MQISQAFVGARLFDGDAFRDKVALLVSHGRVHAVVPERDLSEHDPVIRLDGGIIVPGFIDAQVNGYAGKLLNASPSVGTVTAMAASLRTMGTTAILPTMMTDSPAAVRAAVKAVTAAAARDSCIAGMHLEGPHLWPARRGIHPGEYIRPVEDADIDFYLEARESLGVLIITVAGEQITPGQVRELTAGGVVVSLGHTDCDFTTAMALFDAGATGVSHLFNAMSGFSHRAPGAVGAALEHPSVWCSIIADGHHVSPPALRIAHRAKRGEGRLFLITDAMSLAGSPDESFTLHGSEITKHAGDFCSRLLMTDGTLAGSDLDMLTAIRYTLLNMETGLTEALRMATSYPARFLGLNDRGHLRPGHRADFLHLTDTLHIAGVWTGGRKICDGQEDQGTRRPAHRIM
ncbi:N-acetylglucosamine-6-phosphate deacetylase [Rhizobium sp. PAMB 3174]